MKTWLGWLALSLVFVFIGSYAWTHRRHLASAVAAEQAPQNVETYAEEREAAKMVTVTGPLADYVARQGPSNVETLKPETLKPRETYRPASHTASAADRDGGESPVGTSTPLLHKTFRVAEVVDLPFVIPAHASIPQLHGTYRSFVQVGGTQSSDSTADVEFMVLTEKQYADFLAGRPGDALFSAEAAHDGEINLNLPPTYNQTAKYYLVFRNGAPSQGKKAVQADFRVDF